MVSPYFNWSPKFWLSTNRPTWTQIQNARQRTQMQQRFFSDSSLQVSASVTAAVVGNKSIGDTASSLVAALINTRNAEHDQARYTLRKIRTGLSSEQLIAWLKTVPSTSNQKATVGSDLYWRVRARQALLFTKLLEQGSLSGLQTVVTYLVNRRRLHIAPMLSA